MRWVFLLLLLLNGLLCIWALRQAGHGLPPVSSSAVVADLKGGVKLILLEEVGQEERDRLYAEGRERELLRLAQSGVDGGDDKLCTLVGAFGSARQAEQLIEYLAALEVEARLQEVEVPDEAGYWVHLPPEASRKQALRRLHELQAKGIDSFVIPKGELANGISFGMFGDAQRSQSYLERLRGMGYQAQLKEVARTHKETWVILQPLEAGEIDEELWTELLGRGQNLEKRQNFCPPIAFEEKFP